MPVTMQTLQAILKRCFPHAQGIADIQPLVADASTRRYFRAQWSLPNSSLPATCILMACDPWPATTTPDFLAVEQHLRACNVHVPQVYGIDPEQGLMCLQDYGDQSLATYWQDVSGADRLQWGKYAIDELVKMHTLGTQRVNPACPAFRLAFDVPKLLSELQFFRQHAIEGLWQHTLTTSEHDALQDAFTALCTILAAQPQYFCHRDYHGWNLMVHNGAIGVLDFQDARLGPQPYDLVSLLTDRGMPNVLGDDGMSILVDYYIQRMESAEGRRMSRQEFNALFDYVAIQRGLKAIGTFAYMTTAQQRRQYLPYIQPTLTYIKPLIARYDMLQPLALCLCRYLP